MTPVPRLLDRLRLRLVVVLLPRGWEAQRNDTREMRRQWERMTKGTRW